jgi:hypothetical protein
MNGNCGLGLDEAQTADTLYGVHGHENTQHAGPTQMEERQVNVRVAPRDFLQFIVDQGIARDVQAKPRLFLCPPPFEQAAHHRRQQTDVQPAGHAGWAWL